MELLLHENVKETHVDFGADEDISVIFTKKNRRVSFAETQTVHVIPRHYDVETPPIPNVDPPPSNSKSATGVLSSVQRSVGPGVPVAERHDLPLNEHAFETSQHSMDMDTGHGSLEDTHLEAYHNSFDEAEDDSGCFVHLGHISRIDGDDDDDSIVNEVFNGDMTMDAVTFSRNLSQFLKSGTTFDLPMADMPGKAVKILNDSDTRSEDDSMILTRTGRPHWALNNPQDVSTHADDQQSDMSLAPDSERIRVKKKVNFFVDNKVPFTNAKEQSSPGYSGKSMHPSNNGKENLAPHNSQEGYHRNSPGGIESLHSDLDVSMSIGNTTDISVQSLPRHSDILKSIDGNSQTSLTSRRRSDTMMQDTSFSAGDINSITIPVRNLKDILLDHTDYTMTQKCNVDDLLKSNLSVAHSWSSNGLEPVSCSRRNCVDFHVSDVDSHHVSPNKRENSVDSHHISNVDGDHVLDGDSFHVSPNKRENVVGSMHYDDTRRACKEFGVVNDIDKLHLVDKIQNKSSVKASQQFKLEDDSNTFQVAEHRQNISSNEGGLTPVRNSYLKYFHTASLACASSKTSNEDLVASSHSFKQQIVGYPQENPHARPQTDKHAEQKCSGNSETLVRTMSQSSSFQNRAISVMFNDNEPEEISGIKKHNSDRKSSVMKKHDKQVQAACHESKSDPVEPNEPSKGTQSLQSAPQLPKVEQKNHSKRVGVLNGKVHMALEESKSFQETPKSADDQGVHYLPMKGEEPSVEKIKSVSSREVPLSGRTVGSFLLNGTVKSLRSFEDVLDCIKVNSQILDEKVGDENIVPIPQFKLQTLYDYLHFSCSVQPQMDWLNENIKELEVKLQNAMERNKEYKSCSVPVQLQKLPEESFNCFKRKFASKRSLAEKGWIIWKIKAQKKILSWLQESKDNLMKEIGAAKMKGQQVLQLKDMYAQIVSEMDLDDPSFALSETLATFTTSHKRARFRMLHKEKDPNFVSQSIKLENLHHHYQEACNELNELKMRKNDLVSRIQVIASIHNWTIQTDEDKDMFKNSLTASIGKLSFRNSLLQRQQLLRMTLRTEAEKPVINFSLGGMYFESLENDKTFVQALLTRRLCADAIEEEYPCMEAPLFFEYLCDDLHGKTLVKLWQLDGAVQRSSNLLGSWMDVLTEVKFCRRNFGIACKFHVLAGKLFLRISYLQTGGGSMITVEIDMTFLKGVSYPFDRKPADVQVQTFGSWTKGRKLTRGDILSRIEKVPRGFGRLARICNCIEAVLTSSMHQG
ncbi:hypothetical protein KP509_09G042800 [Ceratopteris richardii]|uniref:Uncharacterized protein n=1 Tax=Ceratopteris richardii TaxID=49495 RepID=A0A8T2U241_CERRI|nr:hypothetical protein KP509_09G042800 [Ceratopteris richardii]